MGLTLVDLDQPTLVVDAHQLAAQSYFHLLTRRTESRRHRVERLPVLQMVVLMDLGGAPVVDVVGPSILGDQGVALLILEDRQRPPAGGAAGPYSGQLQALPRDLVPHVGQTVAIGALRKRSLAWRYVPFPPWACPVGGRSAPGRR